MQNFYEGRKKRMKFNHECGAVFGRLTYTGKTYTINIYNHWVRFIEAVCICGTVKDYQYTKVTCGEVQSCGCLRSDTTRKRMTTHNLSGHPLYVVWQKMISRCYDKNDIGFKNYGARNIEVWKDWKDNFIEFYTWCIENGYEKGKSIDRINNDGNYAPFNCRMATPAEQSRNKRSTRFYEAFGETKCLFDWGKDERCIVGVWALRARVDKGMYNGDFTKCLTEPEDRKKSSQNSKTAILLTAWGETKCMSDWVKDSRCLVGINSLRKRLKDNWDAEKAMTFPVRTEKAVVIKAWGEEKSMANWLKDERCLVKIDSFRNRLRNGWNPEEAMSSTKREWY